MLGYYIYLAKVAKCEAKSSSYSDADRNLT